MFVDAHAHLDDAQYDDVAAVIRRAEQGGVRAIVSCGVDIASSRAAVALAEQFPIVWAAVGIHPNETARARADDLDELRRLAAHPKVVAIGEIGLDYYRDWAPREVQQRWFEQQLDLAAELGLPVCIHARDAYPAVLATLRAWRERGAASQRGMLHCFSGTLAEAAEGVALGMAISIAGPVTYPKATALAEVVRAVPLDRLLTETDAPYLAPQAIRGKRNEPAWVAEVAARIAELKDAPLEEVAACTATTARRLFNIPE
ncbi:MAG: TatD family hydrolase [Chloroflexota bacterium]|nr:TatD family hydrolase [Dehalococcoidia bacterium]MDW8253759.1 TatD family hydrolase [Chloroflexota bacterium]